MSARAHAEDHPTAWSYLRASRLWRRRTGGPLIVSVAVAAIAGGMAGSQLAVVVLMAVAVVVTLGRRGQP